jgi:hypothetical protein
MEIIVIAAGPLASLLTGGEGNPQLEKILEVVIFALLLAVVFFARQLALWIPIVRWWSNYGERFVGRYVQIIKSGPDRRYSILDIRYESYSKGYVLRGFQYEYAGEAKRAIDFDSYTVAFHKGHPTPYIEFLWKAETLVDAARFDGYTYMSLDDADEVRKPGGRGFFITFHASPLRFDLTFVKLTKERLAELGLQDPKDEPTRREFVKGLHLELEKRPDLQLVRDKPSPGKPLL